MSNISERLSSTSSSACPTGTMADEAIRDFEEQPEVIDDREVESSKPRPTHSSDFQYFDADLRKLLVQVTGQTDTASISTVRMRVVTKQAGLHRLAEYTPRLKALVLDGSCVDSLRDLGSSLRHLEALSVARCSLKSLDGLWGFRSLKSLVARDNSIKDPSPCSGVRKLANLDLAYNDIEDPYTFAFLRSCKYLRVLEVAGNRFEDCREIVTSLVPQIRVLDGEEIEAIGNAAETRGVSDVESESTSEEEEIVFLSDPEDDDFWLVKRDEETDIELKTKDETERRPHACELGAGDDGQVTVGLKKPCVRVFEKDNVKIRAKERCLDSSSSSIFLMTHEFDGVSMIDFSPNNVGDYNRGSEAMTSTLTSGRAICGNLAVSLRARSSSKNPFTLPTSRASLTQAYSTQKFSLLSGASERSSTLVISRKRKHAQSTEPSFWICRSIATSMIITMRGTNQTRSPPPPRLAIFPPHRPGLRESYPREWKQETNISSVRK